MSESENAWIFPLGKEARLDGFMIIVDHVSSEET